MRDHLLLFVNGQPERVAGEDALLPLSEFLRRRQRLTGTKVVCAEGDCGSCTVLLGRIEGNALRYAAVTSCIQMMLQLDATHIVTVEGLRQGPGLNAIQDSLVRCQGTQCGFCTPGFVVSLYDLMRDGRPCDADRVKRGLVGNLCRCTGYDSIIQSALETDRTALPTLDTMYPPELIIESLRNSAAEEVLIDAPPHRLFKPTSLTSAARFRADNPGAVILSGGTDLGVLQNKRLRSIGIGLSTAGLSELREITVDSDAIHVGATASLSDLERVSLQHLPELGRFMSWFGSPLIKNAGTLAGNLVTGSPIGDTIPVLMVLEASIDLVSIRGRRTVPIAEFYTGYRKTVLADDEILATVHVPLLKADEALKLYKVSRRKDLDISTFSAAFWFRRDNAVITDIRIAYGGVGPMVLRLTRTEELLRGKTASLELFERAGEIAREEVTPISDVRGSETYRRRLAGNILLKLWHEVFGNGGNGSSGNGHVPASPSSLTRPALARDPEGAT